MLSMATPSDKVNQYTISSGQSILYQRQPTSCVKAKEHWRNGSKPSNNTERDDGEPNDRYEKTDLAPLAETQRVILGFTVQR